MRCYSELQRQIRKDLRAQHPEWVQRNGESPMCDSYELRLAELLGLSSAFKRGEDATVSLFEPRRQLPKLRTR